MTKKNNRGIIKNNMNDSDAINKYHLSVERADGQTDNLVVSEGHQQPEDVASTRLERVNLRNGGNVDYQEFALEQEMILKARGASKILQVCVMLPLEGAYSMITPEGEECHFTPNQGFMFRYIGEEVTFTLPGHQTVRSLGFCVSLDVFKRYLDNQIPDTIKPMLQSKEIGSLPVPFQIDNFMRETLDRNLQVEAQGSLKQIRWEGTALLCMALVEEKLHKAANPETFSLTQACKQKAEAALELLMADMQDPPCLADLAQELSITEKKLNLIFKSLYGDTVFEYLRSIRLNKAKNLIEQTNMAMKEIAWTVGYNHSTNFSKAFTRQFNITPANFAKKTRKLTKVS